LIQQLAGIGDVRAGRPHHKNIHAGIVVRASRPHVLILFRPTECEFGIDFFKRLNS